MNDFIVRFVTFRNKNFYFRIEDLNVSLSSAKLANEIMVYAFQI